MAERNEQIEMLNAAKADVQNQLDDIFDEESEKLVASVSCLSQIDPERMAQFLARTIYERFNSHDEAIRSKVIDSFSAAFGAMVEGVSPKCGADWDAEGGLTTLLNETQTPVEAA